MARLFDAEMIRTEFIGRGRGRGQGGRFQGLDAEQLRLQLEIDIQIDAQLERQLQQVADALQRNAIRSLKGAAYEISQYAKASIVTVRREGGRGGRPSRPGHPVHTRGIPGKNVRAAIRYGWANAEKTDVVVGPTAEMMDRGMQVHEHGGTRGRSAYPARAVMQPALERELPKLPQRFRGIVGP